MDKKLFFPIIMSFLTVLGMQYFFNKDEVKDGSVPQNVQPGQSYKVPTREELSKPINLEIDFLDKKVKAKEVLVEVESEIWKASFSNFGGVLATLEFKNHIGVTKSPLQTIYKKSFFQREETCFLVALNEKTPYFYKFEEKKDLGDRFVVVYKVETDGWIIRKVYNLHKDSYQIDFKLEIEKSSKSASAITPRLFFNSPFIGEIEDDTSGVIYSNAKDGIDQEDSSDKIFGKAWVAPSYFGLENKYFAHTMIKNSDDFVRRAFFKKTPGNRLQGILEGPEIESSKSWNFSFYMGPKSLDDLVKVDEKLETLLSFGWFSFIAKLFVKWLDYFYRLIGNYGIAIILLTLLVKIPFIPLSIYSRKKMDLVAKHQPFISRIKTKFKGDLARQSLEMNKYYKDHNLSQMAQFQGCLPMLIQIPVFFSLFRVLRGYLDLYQAPFYGWIIDLSSKDPFYVLPLLMGASMIWQQRLSPTKDEKMKTAMLFMPLVMVAVFINMPAGLVLYMLVNNLFTLGEDVLRKRVFR